MATILKIILTDRRRKTLVKYARIPLALLLVCGLFFLYRYDPQQHAYYPPCIFKRLTGLNCAGCGSARACYQLLHGHIARAADYNVLLVIFLPFIIWGLYVNLTGRGLRIWNKISKPVPVLVLICLFWVLRNIDLYPLTWLHADK